MTCPVHIAGPAAAEIDEATAWIQARNPEAARRWYWGLLAAIEGLGRLPHRHPVARTESAHFGLVIRQLVYGKGVGRYRVLYTVTERAVFVLHVRHGRRLRLDQAAPTEDE
ncbi:MAG TPA: type II toxin-antitoxin system RelE/ParE family toxin [Verrucomicrobiota bacterium]|nr:type II toxin-antitoxin system RelE/ParE family toxin [Verrucomicrobiota bacterium]HRZ34914.1 type II toxin-antitoxin system RelE/ParE family toxin [Candidatus Paceibacterota bacterium]HRZ55600.1 type II toxin-antitoxin system RelE/ParE family toxin [Candidatus Paceibacterota bacterium]